MKKLWSVHGGGMMMALAMVICACGLFITKIVDVVHAQTSTINGVPSQGFAIAKVTSSSIGGSLLTVGTPATTTVTVTGATTAMGCHANPSAGNALLVGTFVDCYVSSANTVTLRLMGVSAVTPTSQSYDVRVLP
jgi:hypothetical protein